LSQAERRLAAIMFTDIVGYTALAQRDEALAMDLLAEHNRLLRPLFQRHNGREVKTIGDSFLVEFPSALEAVRCAFDVQQTLHDYNSSAEADRRIQARVGVHVGDVLHRDGDVFGDAVNIASRIEPMAEPGGVCISEQVFSQVRNKFEFPITSLGPQRLKNVDLPTEVFRVALPWARPTSDEAPPAPRTRIAVLPFANISPDPNDEYFADGMTEELINTISHNHQLKVIARTSVGRFKGSPKSVSEIGREIGVGSILEGSVRKAGNKVRVTAQLVDAATEEHVWSDNYDRQMDDIFSIQSEIAKSVSDALMVRLVPEERLSVEKRATANPSAYIRYLRGRTALRDRTESALKEARRYFEDAIAEDQNYAEAYAGLADSLFLLGNYGHLPMAEATQRGKEALAKALSLDDGLAEAHTSLANYLLADYRFAEAEAEFRKAIGLNPSYILARHWFCIHLLESGKIDEAIEQALVAEELDPLSPIIAFNTTVLYAFLGDEAEAQKRFSRLKELDTAERIVDATLAWMSEQKGDYGAAAAHMEVAAKKNPKDLGNLSTLGFYYAMAGRKAEAEKILGQLSSSPEGTFGKPMYMATVYAGLNDRDGMFGCLDKAFEERSLAFRTLRYARFDPGIRKDERYLAIFQRASLTP
jgi:adenylate cyclase